MEFLPKKIEVHYYFNDDSHSMDALVKNKCEAEFLAVAYEVASLLGFSIELSSEALREGGLIDAWNALGSNSNQIALILSALAIIWSVVPHTDNELLDLQKEDLKLSIQEKKLSIEKINKELENNNISDEVVNKLVDLSFQNYKVVTRKSNFYKNISAYKKVTEVGFSPLDERGIVVASERIVPRSSFDGFIITSSELEPLVVESARIEIVAPVLKDGRSKWKGIYHDESINISMHDAAFREKVLSKKLSFKSGDEIICVLLIHRKLNELGEVITSGYTVEVVSEHLESGVLKETLQGRAYRQERDQRDGQADLFQ
jgi:hypothetical protein